MAAGSPINRNAAIHAESVRWAVEEALPTAGAVLGKVNKGEVEVFIGSNVCLSFCVICRFMSFSWPVSGHRQSISVAEGVVGDLLHGNIFVRSSGIFQER
jgi:hypothetical protein